MFLIILRKQHLERKARVRGEVGRVLGRNLIALEGLFFVLKKMLIRLTKHKYSIMCAVKKFGTVKSMIHARSP